MKIKFYGTRGSILVCASKFQEFGGNTTCIQIRIKETNNIGILDAGTVIRDLGKDFLASGHTQSEIFIAFTHFHWDHIQGFPFFSPAFVKNQNIYMLALGWGRRLDSLEDIFKTQMQKYWQLPITIRIMMMIF